MEEPDGPVRDATLPEHGQDPVVHPGEDDRRLKWMPANSSGGRGESAPTWEQAEGVIVMKHMSLKHYNNDAFSFNFYYSEIVGSEPFFSCDLLKKGHYID